MLAGALYLVVVFDHPANPFALAFETVVMLPFTIPLGLAHFFLSSAGQLQQQSHSPCSSRIQ